MAPPVRRKTRVTKDDIAEARKEMKISSYQRKRKIIPGPWTAIETDFKVKPSFKLNKSAWFKDSYYGAYTYTHNWYEKGWYPILFNLLEPKMQKLIKKHGMDKFIAAVEKAFNEMKGSNSKPVYGNIIILEWSCDHSNDEDPERRFISIKAKTNKKNIPGFSAIRKGKYVLVGSKEELELGEDTDDNVEDTGEIPEGSTDNS